MSAAAMGVISVFAFAMGMTLTTKDTSEGYNVARATIEQIKVQGFTNATEGTTTVYYNADLSGPNGSSGANTKYKVVTVITSDKFAVQNGVSSVAQDALRAVAITVINTVTGATIYQTGTTLCRAGI
jgi:hypothetical protein